MTLVLFNKNIILKKLLSCSVKVNQAVTRQCLRAEMNE